MDLTCKLHILQDLRQAQNARKENELKFCTLKEASTAEIVEKKSRFIANSCHIESKEEAEEKINLIKKKYYDAKHNCFSFSIVDKDGNLLEKSSDDGEPYGTAGAPILNVIRKNNLNNVLIVVTRYFGGILLGTGGLTRAYSNTALASIENGKIIEVENGLQASLEIEYSENEKFKYYCERNNIKIVETKYSENIIQKIELNEEEYNKLISKNMEINRQLPFKIKEIGILCRKFVEKVQ